MLMSFMKRQSIWLDNQWNAKSIIDGDPIEGKSDQEVRNPSDRK